MNPPLPPASLVPPCSSRRRALHLERFEERVLMSIAVVSSTLDDGSQGTLRWALGQANTPGSKIEFAIPGTGVQTINLTSPLPAIAVPITIDATTQPGYVGSPVVVLNGTNAGKTSTGAPSDGLDLTAGNTTIEGLDIVNFGGNGITISTTNAETSSS